MESYVLGLATDAERLEFEQQCAAYPEVLEARDAFERSLEAQLIKDAVAPPAFVKERILDAVKPATTETSLYEEETETPVRRLNVWKWVAAASLILLAGTAYWAFTTNEKYKELAARQTTVEQDLQQKNEQLAGLEQDRRAIQSPGLKVAELKGTANAPQALTTVFWDSTSKDVYLLVNNLPQPASDKQYQLWALLDGKPIDLGMLEARQERLVVKMKNVQNAQAFAITLEPRGGSVNPTMEALYVLGNL